MRTAFDAPMTQQSRFSDVSKYLIEHFEMLQSILEAERHLRSELATIVAPIEVMLRRQPWWQNGWVVVKNTGGALQISKNRWKVGGDYVVSISLDGLAPERVFGTAEPPALWIWFPTRFKPLLTELTAVLVEIRQGNPEPLPGDVDRRNNSFFVRHTVPKCAPGMLDTYETRVAERVVSFFEGYATFFDAHEDRILDAVRQAQVQQ